MKVFKLARLPIYMVAKESLRRHHVDILSVPHESANDILVDGYYFPEKLRIRINDWGSGNANEFIAREVGTKLILKDKISSLYLLLLTNRMSWDAIRPD